MKAFLDRLMRRHLVSAFTLSLLLLVSLSATSFAATRSTSMSQAPLHAYASADDGDGSIEVDTSVNIHGDDDTDYSADSPTATTVPLTRWYDPTPPNSDKYNITTPYLTWDGPSTITIDYGLHYVTTQTSGNDVKSTTAYTEGIGTGNLGYVYSSSQANTTPIYSCFLVNNYSQTFKGALVVIGPPTVSNVGQHLDATVYFQISQQFVSTDSNCESQNGGVRDQNFRTGPLGYVSMVELPNSQPLYRCRIPQGHNGVDHFLTHDSNCEGQVFEGQIGWTLNSAA